MSRQEISKKIAHFEKPTAYQFWQGKFYLLVTFFGFSLRFHFFDLNLLELHNFHLFFSTPPILGFFLLFSPIKKKIQVFVKKSSFFHHKYLFFYISALSLLISPFAFQNEEKFWHFYRTKITKKASQMRFCIRLATSERRFL